MSKNYGGILPCFGYVLDMFWICFGYVLDMCLCFLRCKAYNRTWWFLYGFILIFGATLNAAPGKNWIMMIFEPAW
jgi:hypothetical protein